MHAPLFVLLSLIAAAPKAPPRHKLRPPGYISSQLRELIDKRMEHHGESALALTMGVLLLEYDAVGSVAEQLAERPGFARPRPGADDVISNALPPRFFDFQDQLRARARALAKAAAARDTAKISAAYNKLTATCVACHASYLNGPGSEEGLWADDSAEAH